MGGSQVVTGFISFAWRQRDMSFIRDEEGKTIATFYGGNNVPRIRSDDGLGTALLVPRGSRGALHLERLYRNGELVWERKGN